MTGPQICVCILLGALVIYWWLSDNDDSDNRYPDVV